MMDFNKNTRLNVFKSELVEGAYFSDVYEFPLATRTDFKPKESIPFDFALKTKKYNQWVHFYRHDYIFERVWKEPNRYLPILKRFQGVITPDFSLYREMPLAMQIWNTYRNRAIGYWLQNNGIDIVTNVRWGDERTYAFAFEGLPKGGTYAVCTNGCIQGKLDRYYFQKGLEKMVEVLNPDTILNYQGIPEDIFGSYKEQGIEILTLDYWRDALRKAAN